MKNKKFVYLMMIVIVLIGVLGLTYALYRYNQLGQNQQLVVGDIYMHYNETDTTILIDNMMPTNQPTSDYFQFTISGKNTSIKDNIIYNIQLVHGENTTNKTQRIDDKFLKFRLTDENNNIIVDDLSFDEINNTTIYSDVISKNSNQEVNITYRLYMWLSNDISICSGDIKKSCDYYINTTDETKDWNNLYASIKINVNGATTESNLQDFEISGSNTITVKSSGITTSKYELINMQKKSNQANLLTNTDSVVWEISPETPDIQIEDGLVTLSEGNTLDKFTIKAKIDNITYKKDITLYKSNSLPENLFKIVKTYENEFVDPTDGHIYITENNELFNVNYIRTDYIECDPSKVLFINTALEYSVYVRIAFYDENKNYISGLKEHIENPSVYLINDSLNYGNIINIPEEAKYMMLNMDLSHYNNTVASYHYINAENIRLYDMNLEYPITTTLSNIKTANFGDDIFGKKDAASDISNYMTTYFGSTNYNVAFGGTRMSLLNSDGYKYFSITNLVDSIYERDFTNQIANKNIALYYDIHTENLVNIDFSTLDYVTIAFGTNDYNAVNWFESDDLLNVETYKGATRYSINKLKQINPNIKIILLTPIYRFWRDENTDATNRANSKGLYLIQYGNALKEISKEYENVYVYDGYNDLGINSFNKYVYFNYRNEMIPNSNGIKLYAYKLGKFIESLENQQ